MPAQSPELARNMAARNPAKVNTEQVLLSVLQDAATPLSAEELVTRARADRNAISSSEVLSAAWHLVGKGQARFTDDRRLIRAG
jgi:hypothetical protein